MATVIDALVLTLGLDPKSFIKGAKEANKAQEDVEKQGKKTAKGLKDSGNEMAQTFEKLTIGMGKFLAMLGGAYEVKAFIEDITDSNAELNRLSKNLGESTQSISAWAGAVEEIGGSGKALQGTMQMLSKSMTDILVSGDSAALPYFRMLGVDLQFARTQADPLSNILDQLHTGLSGIAATAGRANANNIGLSMGIDQDTLNLLLATDKEYQSLRKRQMELSAVSKEQAENSAKLQRQWILLHQEMRKAGRDVVGVITPALEWLGRAFAGIASHEGLVIGFFGTLAVAAAAALIPVLALLAPLAMIAAPFIAGAAVIGVFFDDWKTWMDGGKSAFGDFYQAVADQWHKMEDVLGLDKLKAQWTQFKKWIRGEGGENEQATSTEAANLAFLKGRKTQAGVSEAQALSYFQSQGWTRAQAAGIVANLKRESGLNGASVGDNGSAYGLAQWHPDRQAAFKAQFGRDIRNSTAQEQLAFVQYELTRGSEKGAGSLLRGTTDAMSAGATLSQFYERPADRAGESATRAAMALAIAGSGTGPLRSAANAAGGNSSVETNIGTINLHTQATDGRGVLRDFVAGLQGHGLVSQSDSGTF